MHSFGLRSFDDFECLPQALLLCSKAFPDSHVEQCVPPAPLSASRAHSEHHNSVESVSVRLSEDLKLYTISCNQISSYFLFLQLLLGSVDLIF